MDRKLFGIFSGRQLTAMILGAMFVPGALYAIPSFTNVAIEDPVTGSRASVDSAHRLYVFDYLGSFRTTPASFIDVKVINNGTQCEVAQAYTIPAGKALVITAISGYATKPNTALPFTGYNLYKSTNCSGALLTDWFATDRYAPVAVELGNGIPVAAGQNISVYSSNNGGHTYIHGYLVPASALPPS